MRPEREDSSGQAERWVVIEMPWRISGKIASGRAPQTKGNSLRTFENLRFMIRKVQAGQIRADQICTKKPSSVSAWLKNVCPGRRNKAFYDDYYLSNALSEEDAID